MTSWFNNLPIQLQVVIVTFLVMCWFVFVIWIIGKITK